MIDQKNLKAKRKQRRKQTAEDFTPAWLVNEILDKIGEYSKEAWEDPRKTFIDPACGNGNFLVEVAKKKLKLGHRPMDVAKTVFGLDIMLDNVIEARFRLYRIFDMYEGLTEDVVTEVWKNVKKVENTLTVDFEKSVFKKPSLKKEKVQEIIRKVSEMNQGREKVKARREFVKTYFYNNEHIEDIQSVHTPFDLTNAVVKKLGEYACLTDCKSFLCFNLEFVEALLEKGVAKGKITFISECESKVEFARQLLGVKGILDNFVERKFRGKFDVIVGNPPYQSCEGDNKIGKNMWPHFVEKSFEICKEDGFVSLIHPSSWRAKSRDVKPSLCLFDKNIKYLEIHDKPDGMKTFGATTRYDWYVCQNGDYQGSTEVVGEDGIECDVDISVLPIIPNKMIDKIVEYIVDDTEESVDILHSYSAYFTLKPWMSKKNTSKFKHPVVYSTPVKGPTIFWSSDDTRGHFGVSKLIFNPANPISVVMDAKGEYAMSQFCCGIVGDKKYLDMVATVFKNQKTNGFADFMEASHLTNKVFDMRLFSMFRKDFWKDFI